MEILHLSDLHFGYDKDDTMRTQRENLLDSLVDNLTSKKIDIVIITGDIVWQCKNEGYIKAEEWIKKLSNKINVPFSNFIICAGNHEVDHNETREISYILNSEKIEATLKVEYMEYLERRFEGFINFCKNLGVSKPQINNKDNYLIGSIDFDEAKFWVVNTAWYALEGGDSDRNKLWIGSNFYDCLLKEKNSNFKDITVLLSHHPKEWLNENETQTASNNKSLYEMISGECDINFTGHTHGNVQDPDTRNDHMLFFSAGASYKKTDYSHNFSIFSLDCQKRTIIRSAFISKNRTEWELLKKKSYILPNRASANVVPSERHNKEVNKNTIFKEIIEKIGINPLNVMESDFSSKKVMIWPVVPRRVLNLIHLAQLELMSLLCKWFGWSIQAIISNCGANPLPADEIEAFVKKVEKYHEKAGIQNFKFEYLDSFFMKDHDLATRVLECFIKICSIVKLPDLKLIKEKKYGAIKRDEIQKQPVLDYILPTLQFAVIDALAQKIKKESGKKSIIIAGNDEMDQWIKAVSIIGEDFIGPLLIPELNNNNGENINQDNQNQDLKNIIECCSKEQFKNNLNIGNVANWFYKMFFILPKYKQIDNNSLFSINQNVNINSFKDYECKDQKTIDQIWDEIENSKIN